MIAKPLERCRNEAKRMVSRLSIRPSAVDRLVPEARAVDVEDLEGVGHLAHRAVVLHEAHCPVWYVPVHASAARAASSSIS